MKVRWWLRQRWIRFSIIYWLKVVAFVGCVFAKFHRVYAADPATPVVALTASTSSGSLDSLESLHSMPPHAIDTSLETLQGMMNQFDVMLSNPAPPRYQISVNDKGVITILFPGTKGADQMRKNFESQPSFHSFQEVVSNATMPIKSPWMEKIKTHMGFMDTWRTIRGKIFGALAALPGVNLLQARFVLMGHSMGGALAQIMAYDIGCWLYFMQTQQQESLDVTCATLNGMADKIGSFKDRFHVFTFGAPPPFDYETSQHFEKLIGADNLVQVRITGSLLNRDIVTMAPPAWWQGHNNEIGTIIEPQWDVVKMILDKPMGAADVVVNAPPILSMSASSPVEITLRKSLHDDLERDGKPSSYEFLNDWYEKFFLQQHSFKVYKKIMEQWWPEKKTIMRKAEPYWQPTEYHTGKAWLDQGMNALSRGVTAGLNVGCDFLYKQEGIFGVSKTIAQATKKALVAGGELCGQAISAGGKACGQAFNDFMQWSADYMRQNEEALMRGNLLRLRPLPSGR